MCFKNDLRVFMLITCESDGRKVAKMAKLTNISPGNISEYGVRRSEPEQVAIF